MAVPRRARRRRVAADDRVDASRDSLDLHRQGKILRESDQEPHVAGPRSSDAAA